MRSQHLPIPHDITGKKPDRQNEKNDVNLLMAIAIVRGYVKGRNRSGEWSTVRNTAEIQGRESGYVVKAQFIDDESTRYLLNTLRSLLPDDRLIVKKRKQCPSDILEIQFAAWLDEMNSGTVMMYRDAAEHDREVRS